MSLRGAKLCIDKLCVYVLSACIHTYMRYVLYVSMDGLMDVYASVHADESA